MHTYEEASKLTGASWDESNVQWARLHSWYHNQQGVEIKPLAEDPTVILSRQWSLTDRGCLYTRKDLVEKARRLYPDKKYKVGVNTYSLQVSDITPEWIQEQMQLYGVKPSDLVRQLALSKASVSVLINGNRPMASHTKALIFYYFLSLRLSKIAYSDINASELQEALEYIRQKRAQEGASGQPSTAPTEGED